MSVHHLFLKKINHISDKYTEKNTPFTNCISSHLRRILREMRYIANERAGTTVTKHKREAQIAIIAILPVDALVVTAAAHGVSSPHGGDQGLPQKLFSFRIDYGRCGDGEWNPPSKNSQFLQQCLAAPWPTLLQEWQVRTTL